MADYTVISSVSRSILELLSSRMVPEVLRSADSIALSSPDEKGDMQLYVYLYHISECREIKQDYQRYGLGPDLRMQDSRFLYLYYQFTAMASSEIRFRALEEQNILGKVIQTFNDNHSIEIQDFSGQNRPPEQGIPVSMIPLTQEEISKIWSGLQQKHKLALYYRVGPVELESELLAETKRVTEAVFEMEES
ncbi:MAG: DUF4255 domain-containing protein [Oscillospiraceae bacterium]|nr:DUF4255 domain-containing protein [Oscillospiraceae bacterium]